MIQNNDILRLKLFFFFFFKISVVPPHGMTQFPCISGRISGRMLKVKFRPVKHKIYKF